MDSDGDLDVLRGLTWYENYDGHGNFVAHEVSPQRTEISLVADLDGDGDLDIITNQPKWYENDGNRQFATEHSFPVETGRFTELKLFDVGGDGDVDVIGLRNNTAHLFENQDGRGTFVEAAVYALPEGWRDVGDFDLDGRLDILLFEHVDYRRVLAIDPTPRDLHINVFWLDRDLGNGTFERQRLWAEMVVASQFPAEGPGTPEWNTFLESIGEYSDTTRGGELADVNGDGLLDLVRRETPPFDPNYRPVVWHENVDGSIAEIGAYVGEEGHGDLWLQDIDHDGDLDALYDDGMQMALVWSLNSAGNFEPGGHYSTWLDESVLDLGDINGDGLINALVRFEDGIPIWLHGITGEEHVNGEVPEPAPTSATVFVPLELRAESGRLFRSADFDNDGRRDFLAGNYQGSNDAVWLADRDGDRTFERQQIGEIARSRPEQLRVQDVDGDGDGDQDLVTLDDSRDNGGLWVHINSDCFDEALPCQ
jgi:hypothetical protein